ncbi:MAG TPA: LysM peptidoglycan-binding domain-containing protein [Gemmatimonadales bacterium]|nr:LysM peptidoglycan-binding domain-containing protein [Gemmatimonadales bacterium]
MSNPLQGGFTPDDEAEEDFSDSGEALEEAEEAAAPAAPAAAPTATAGGRSYTVKAGDSLSKIAKALTGDLNNWKAIYEANKDTIKDPNVIHAGQVLRIPG